MKCTAVMVILNYNDMKVAQKLADSVMDLPCMDRVILVDNCSPDGSYEYLREAYDKAEVDVIRTHSNDGYASGNNFGIRYAIEHYEPDYIFVANPDIAVTEQTLNAMISSMSRHGDYAVMAPLVEKGYNVWRLPGFIGMIESLFLIWFNIDKKLIRSRLLRSEKSIETVGVVEGSFFVIRAEDYINIGGFDERTFLYAEEIILSRRLKDKGRKVGVLTRLRYEHLHSASIKKEYKASKRRAFPNFYRSFKIYNKYYLKTNAIMDAVFAACYGLAYAERAVYDFIVGLKH